MKELISKVVKSFYSKAVQDQIIGYHFRKIQEFKSQDVLTPPIEAFASHLPRIELFWRMQLLGEKLEENSEGFNLIMAHQYLKLNKGEVGRWVTLFNQTLDEFEEEDNKEFMTLWRKRVSHFEEKFLSSTHLF